MANQRQRSSIILDWVNVTYRTAGLWAVAAVLLLAAGGWYWHHTTQVAPRQRAYEAIQAATERLNETRGLNSGDSKVQELKANAETILRESGVAYDAGDWDRALQTALHSETLSRKVIDMVRGDGESPTQVQFLHIEGDVKVKRAGEFSWEPADPKKVLNVGDQVKTTSSGSAQLLYFDGTRSTIHPGSLLEIRRLYENPATKERRVSERLGWGSLHVSTKRQNVPGSEHEVSTKVASARSGEEGEIRVQYDKKKKSARFDSFDSTWNIRTQDRKKSLGSGQTVEAFDDGQLSPVKDLPKAPRLLSPSDQKLFTFEDPSSAELTLRWEPVPGVREYRLSVSQRSLFTDPLFQGNVQETSITVEGLGERSYYWKVEAVMPDGGYGPSSPVRRVKVTGQSVRDDQDRTPPRLEVTDFLLSGPMVIINGVTEPGATLWIDNEKVDVYEDGTFYAVIRLRKEGENVVEFLAQDAAGNENQVRRRAYYESY